MNTTFAANVSPNWIGYFCCQTSERLCGHTDVRHKSGWRSGCVVVYYFGVSYISTQSIISHFSLWWFGLVILLLRTSTKLLFVEILLTAQRVICGLLSKFFYNFFSTYCLHTSQYGQHYAVFLSFIILFAHETRQSRIADCAPMTLLRILASTAKRCNYYD